MLKKFHLLFVCNSNVNRSQLAASLFEHLGDYEVKSAGINPLASIPGTRTQVVNQELINWADKIYVMSETEEKQATFLKEHFNVDGKNIAVLEVPDKYNIALANDYKELKEILTNKLKDYLG